MITYEQRMEFLSHFGIDDFNNPITRASIAERLDNMKTEVLLEPEPEDDYEEYKSEEIRALNAK